MTKKIIFILILSLFVFGLSGTFALAAGRPLEIIYPNIPGTIVPQTTATGLPEYVVYLFHLSIIIIGFVIFGVLVYSGVRYLTSAGDPAKMGDAKEGILAAFLGAVILLSAYLIFNTINPQLTILKLPEVNPLAALVSPGVYICTYHADNIGDILDKYIHSEGDEQIAAAKDLGRIMVNPDDESKRCPRANSSGNFDNFAVGPGNTIFIVPTIKLVPDHEHPIRQPIYEYGIVLHEKDDFRGKCDYYPKEDSNYLIYTYGEDTHQITDFMPKDMEFSEARSVTVFKKPVKDPSSDARGITLYSCFDYNRTHMCPEGIPGGEDGISYPYKPNGDVWNVWSADLGELKENIRSVQIDPQNSYFALVYDGETTYENCALIKSNDPNITDIPLNLCTVGGGACDWTRWFSWSWLTGTKECVPCIESVTVFKGQAL